MSTLSTLIRVAKFPILSLALSISTLASAADWPNQRITVVVPFAPGGGNDLVARLISEPLGKVLGQTVIVENKPGAGGTLGAGYVAQAPADGYTLLLCSTGNIAVAPALYKNLTYQVNDLAPVSLIANTPIVWLGAPTIKANTLLEFTQEAKQQPGVYNYASSGNGTTPHLAAEALAMRYDLKMQHIPYKGTSPAYTDLISGNVSLMMDSVISASGQLEGNRVKGLGIGTSSRLPQFPTIPTLAEQGLDEFNFMGWVGLCAPKNTPEDIVQKIYSGVTSVLAQPDIQAAFAKQIAEPVGASPNEFRQVIETDATRWKKIIEDAGVSL